MTDLIVACVRTGTAIAAVINRSAAASSPSSCADRAACQRNVTFCFGSRVVFAPCKYVCCASANFSSP